MHAQGGGVFLVGASTSADFADCTLSDNEAKFGGGAWIEWVTSLSFTRCNVFNNSGLGAGANSHVHSDA